MHVQANAQGVLHARFTIPEHLPAGNKRVRLVGSGGSMGEATFSGQGTLVRQTLQQVTTVTETRWWSPPPPEPDWAPVGRDPLAQTFTPERSFQCGGVDLWFTARGTTPVLVQLRTTQVGFPSRTILAQARLAPTEIVLAGAPTRVRFDTLVTLRAGEEYALVVLCDDAEASLAVAELGKWDTAHGRWVTSQPYQVGVLLSSSNASTWTAHQDRDLTFSLLRASYTATEHVIDLGRVAVEAATDLMVLAFAEQPDAQTLTQYQLRLPDQSVITVADGQPVRLEAPVTGDVEVSARLRGSERASPVLWPDIQLVVGSQASTADYVSRAIAAGPGSRVRVIFEAWLPGGASVTVAVQPIDAMGAAGDWITLDQPPAAQPLDEGWVELSHALEATEGIDAAQLRCRLTLNGHAAARPRVRQLRLVVL